MKKKGKRVLVKIPGFLHRLGLMVQFSRMNLKYTLVTVIGLTIGLSLLSTSLIQFDSLRADYYYTKLMEHNNKLNLVIQADGSFYDDITNRTINVESQINSLISNYNLANFYEKHSYFPYNGVHFFFMGIESDFAEYAHWQSYYAAEPLESLVTTLFTSEANNSAIIDSETMTREQLTLGTAYTIKKPGMVIPLSIQAITNYWPRMFS
ncbi:MAG: hypothetical protein ACFFC7_09885 [Candidatus Hermodarchaeota archaeon]